MSNAKFKISDSKLLHGFTVVELLVSMGILAILFALTTINLGRLPSANSQAAAIDILISDIRSQQTLAMSTNSSYGVHFESGSYTLFTGSSYSPGNPTNFSVNIDPGLAFVNITFPGNSIVLSPGSGEVVGGGGSFTIENSQINQNQVVNINKYGATY